MMHRLVSGPHHLVAQCNTSPSSKPCSKKNVRGSCSLSIGLGGKSHILRMAATFLGGIVVVIVPLLALTADQMAKIEEANQDCGSIKDNTEMIWECTQHGSPRHQFKDEDPLCWKGFAFCTSKHGRSNISFDTVVASAATVMFTYSNVDATGMLTVY